MPAKRRSSTRVIRETPKRKKQQTQPSPEREPSTHEDSKQPSPTPIPEPHLPTKIVDNLPLPIFEHHQHVTDDLLQSLYESGVLAASLQRSRVKWLGEGLFQRYWTKPTKKKGQVVEPPNNPPKDTMHKIGTCRIIIDPHIFEAILYSIRDPHAPPPDAAAGTPVKHLPPYSHPPTHYNYPPTPVLNPDGSLQKYPYTGPGTPASPHPISHGQFHQVPSPQGLASTHVWQNPSSSAIPSPAPRPSSAAQSPALMHNAPRIPPSQSPSESTRTDTPQPITQQSPPTQQPTIQPTNHAVFQNSSSQSYQQETPAPSQPTIRTANPPPNANQQTAQPQTQSSPPPPKPSQDPVIQMLAQRASTSPELKVLMKIVASGTASTEQLKIFQNHIDELTAILHNRRQAGEASPAPAVVPPTPAPNATQHTPIPPTSTAHPPVGPFHSQYPSPLGPRPPASVLPAKTLPYYSAAPPIHMKPKQFIPPKPEITGVAIEFVAGSGDRFLFPKQSILEFIPQLRQVLASFLVVRKGEDGKDNTASGASRPEKYEAKKSYHQPVTIRLATDHPRVMEMISRAVVTYDEARKYMEETIATTIRAEDVHLAIRLPLEEAVSGEKDDQAALEESSAVQNAPPEKEKKQRAKHQKAAGLPKVDPFKNNCLFCFGPLNGSTATQDGERVCTRCAPLFTKQSSPPPPPNGSVSSIGLALRQQSRNKYSGPHALTLPVV